jgi:transketolase
VNGIEFNTGALGHGLPISVGIALAGKKDELNYRVFTLLGDGELAEGSNWEAALTASQYQLNNLTAIVDRNQLQITGKTKDVCNTEPLAEKFKAFGWDVSEVNGHDLEAMAECFTQQDINKDKPRLVIANTVKGKGISFIEDNYVWHHKVPTDEEFEQAMQELDAYSY